jgi:hypothetical protein
MMSFYLPYAETHYKFRLPWSPLHRKQPEIILDAPFQCLPDRKPALFIVVKDAHYFPVYIEELSLSIQCQGHKTLVFKIPIQQACQQPLTFIEVEHDWNPVPGSYRINGRIHIRDEKERSFRIWNHNLPTLSPEPLEINCLFKNPPTPLGWQAGEMHCHSWHSTDPVEFGAKVSVLQKAAWCTGLQFVLCTDHSYDFYYSRQDYMSPASRHMRFREYQEECANLNPNLPNIIPGEEVSCANHLGKNIHLIIPGPDTHIKGLGDGGRRWFNNKPDLTIPEVLALNPSLPGIAAHPCVKIGLAQRILFRRGAWSENDLHPGIEGLQFWNGSRSRDFYRGRAFWVQQLLHSKKLHPIGGNDAHGDLNFSTGVKTPLVSLWSSRNHIFGKVRTLIKCENTDRDSLFNHFSQKEVCVTDGPFISIHQQNNNFQISAQSTIDYAKLRRVVVFKGKRSATREIAEVHDISDYEFLINTTVDSTDLYVRAECYTESECFAMTSAFFTET